MEKVNQRFIEAVRCNDIYLLHQAIDAGCDINHKDKSGNTALHVASSNGFLDCVKILIENNAIIDALDSNNSTPFQSAIEINHFKIGQLLIKNNANINHQSNGGYTALITAATLGHFESVEMLIKANADINICDNNGLTALDWALKEAEENDYDNCPIVSLIRSYSNSITEQKCLDKLIDLPLLSESMIDF